MKQILKHGVNHAGPAYCSCGCVFTYETEDIITEVSALTSASPTQYVICPECGAKIYICSFNYTPAYNPPFVPNYVPDFPVYIPYDPYWNKPMCNDSKSDSKSVVIPGSLYLGDMANGENEKIFNY